MTSRYKQARFVTIISIICNIILSITKCLGGIIYQSQALLADGIHSISDLVTDALVIVGSKYGSASADKNHPYGHQRFETAATLFLALLLILAGAGIIWEALEKFLDGKFIIPLWEAIPVAILSLIVKEALYHYTKHVARKISSKLLLANAWHHRSDAASSLVVIIGIIASMMGWTIGDALSAIVIGSLIIKMGWTYGWKSVVELVDTAVSEQMQTKIHKLIEDVNGIEKIHNLRSRYMGEDIFIDVHIQLNSHISISEGHYIAQGVSNTLHSAITKIKDITVHVDPEDDEISNPSCNLANRQEIDIILAKHCLVNWEFYNIHYLDGLINIDIYFKTKPDAQSLQSLELLKKENNNFNNLRIMVIYKELL